MTARDIEVAVVASIFPARLFLVVPRVSWGLNMRECDLLALSGRGYAHAIEIKVSVPDLKREFRKRHYAVDAQLARAPYRREPTWIKCKWFAVPYLMREQTLGFVPPEYGVLCVHEGSNSYGNQKVTRERLPTVDHSALPWPQQKRFELARNAMIKYWYQAMKATSA